MKLLSQLRDDAARLADEAAPEVVAALEHLAAPQSLLSLVVALIGRLEQDVPGLVHPDAAPLPAPLSTHTPTDAEAEAAGAVGQFPSPASQQPAMVAPASVPAAPAQPSPADTAELAKLRAENESLRQAVTQGAQPAAPAVPPAVSDQVQPVTAPGQSVQTG